MFSVFHSLFAIQQNKLLNADQQEWQSHNTGWSYNTLTERGKQLHKHAKHFGWKPREVHFQAKQVLTQRT